jgi:hypothetical protein
VRDATEPEETFVSQAIAALNAGDWYDAYSTAKWWIGAGGGAWIVDPWLVYVASALVQGQPRSATHSTDLALRVWIPQPANRAILRWVRGDVIRRRLTDPKTALADLAAAAPAAPAWLMERAVADRDTCAIEARGSRKRKPSVGPAPDYRGPGTTGATVARQVSFRPDGSKPLVWDAVLACLG